LGSSAAIVQASLTLRRSSARLNWLQTLPCDVTNTHVRMLICCRGACARSSLRRSGRERGAASAARRRFALADISSA
jgi:hypothetical protein